MKGFGFLMIFARDQFLYPNQWSMGFSCVFRVFFQGAVNRVHLKPALFWRPRFFKRVFLTSGPVSQRPPPNRADCRSQWRKLKSRRTVAAEIARTTYENMLPGSAPCFLPQVNLHFLVESKCQQLILHHTNRIAG